MSDQVDLKRCAHCGAWIPAEATMCSACGTSDVDGTRDRGGGGGRRVAVRMPRGWTVTRVIVWANVAYLLFAVFAQARWAEAHGYRFSVLRSLISFNGLTKGNELAGWYDHADVAHGQWWRLVTAFFLHGGLIHIGMNMWVLSRIGPFLEDLLGSVRYLVVYLVSGIGSTAAISIWFVYVLGQKGSYPMVGASGAIFGILGALATYTLRAGNARGRALGMALWRDIGLMLFLGVIVPVISNTGHVGGLIPGVAFGLLVGSRFGDRLRPDGQRTWMAAAGLLSAFVVIALAHGMYFALQHIGG